MRRSIETELVQHHENLKYLMENLGRSSLEMNMEESSVITLEEAFKNIFMILFIGII